MVDDHMLLSQAIADVVDNFKDFSVLYTAKNGADLIEKLKANVTLPNLILMDVNMPLMNGIETTKYLHENYPEIKVMALSVEEDENTILAMIRAGAKGYLLKDVDKKTLEMAVTAIMETGLYHSNAVSELLMKSQTKKFNVGDIELKPLEMELLKLICSELTYKEMAEKLNISAKSVDGYRDNLFHKLEVKNRIGLVLYAIKHKIYIP